MLNQGAFKYDYPDSLSVNRLISQLLLQGLEHIGGLEDLLTR